MGKRYRCDYCDKTMVAAPLIVKTHNKGLVHQKCVQEHYQQYKSAETILAEESVKKPCGRYLRGDCAFGSICRYSHYTPDQLIALRNIVASSEESNVLPETSYEELFLRFKNERLATPSNKETVLYDDNGIMHIFPWSDSVLKSNVNLPPSIKRFKIDDFREVDFGSWGS